jgi:hypothetical protein
MKSSPFTAEYRLKVVGESTAEAGSGLVTFSDYGIELAPQKGAPIDIRFSDISDWGAEEYCVHMSLTDGTVLELLKLARRFDEFSDTFRSCRQRHFSSSLLLEEGEQLNFDGFFEHLAASGESLSSGACSISLQKTSLACFPDSRLPFLVAYGSMLEALRDQALYGVAILCDNGERLNFFRLARRTDEFASALDERNGALAIRQSSAVAALAPHLGAMALRKCTSLLRDGVPAGKDELETAVPGFWDALWLSGFCEDRREYAEALLTKASAVFVVLKETGPWGAGEDTPAALLDRRLLYLFQIGATLVVETPSNDDSATYIFAVTGDCRNFARDLCRALAAIQFRREPVYLPESALYKPPYNCYAEAIRILPALAHLRSAFLGRAIHRSVDSWLHEVTSAYAKVDSNCAAGN